MGKNTWPDGVLDSASMLKNRVLVNSRLSNHPMSDQVNIPYSPTLNDVSLPITQADVPHPLHFCREVPTSDIGAPSQLEIVDPPIDHFPPNYSQDRPNASCRWYGGQDPEIINIRKILDIMLHLFQNQKYINELYLKFVKNQVHLDSITFKMTMDNLIIIKADLYAKKNVM